MSLGHVSFRNESTGTYFIQKLCDELDENGSTQELERLLNSVKRQVSYGLEMYTSDCPDGLKQMPCTISTLTKNLIFAKKDKMSSENSSPPS